MAPRIEFLYHYFDRSVGPFVNLSALAGDEAALVQDELRTQNRGFAARRQDGYLERRRELEGIAFAALVAHGGRPRNRFPHYLVVEECPWLETWYGDPDHVKIPWADIDPLTLSFTYGDLFPTFSDRVNDRKEYRRRIYASDEIGAIIERYGLPQVWNAEGLHGPERYIEVQLWADPPQAFRPSRP